MRVFEGKHSQDWAEIAENEEICDLHDKNGGLRFFWQLVQLNYALVSQMGCLELFIFENGQPMTTPPPKVYFWAFRLTVNAAIGCLTIILATTFGGPDKDCTNNVSALE